MNIDQAVAELKRQLPMVKNLAAQVICPKPSSWDKLGEAFEKLIRVCGQTNIVPVVNWIQCSEEMPDADTTVMIFIPADDEQVWLGWLDGKQWRYVDASGVDHKVTHWAHIPMGPKEVAEIVHLTPPHGKAVCPCCGRTPFELPRTDRMTNCEQLVTCRAKKEAA